MRFLKLIPAVAALTGALAIAPPGASAFKHPSPFGLCRVSINLAPRIIVANDPITIWGRLSCLRPASAADKTVRLFQHVRGTPGLTYVQSVTTDANGFYEIEKAGGDVTTNRFFLVRSHGAQSARREVLVEAEVNLSGPPEGTQLYTGPANAVTFTGTVDPADAGARVILQRQNALTGDEWHAIDRGVVQGDGTFSITHAFRYPGDADIRVLVRSGGINIPSRSNVLTYEISQAQNPALTINSSTDPITFGQATTISGTLTGPGGQSQQVTLYARIAGQRYTPIAQTMTNTEGAYSFGPESPSNSTFYRVRSAGERSAVLYEGVRYLLTAQVSQTQVQAGAPVTFSGAVAPGHAGGIVYLERKDAKGPGYHVIQVARITEGSTYTIEHRFYDAGTKTVRIFVPGDPLNAAAASQPFAIEVAPAPIAALAPENPTNSSQSSEGQATGAGGGESTSGSLEAEAQETPGAAGSGGSSEHHKSTTEAPSSSEAPSTPETPTKESTKERHHRRSHQSGDVGLAD
jgi:hypothetical protein